jgi:hypothetical protein
LLATIAITGALWVLTVLAARDVALWIPTMVWSLIALFFLGSSYRDSLPRRRWALARLRDGSVREHRIWSEDVVKFEEEEDEGACFAFQISQERIVFVCGQDFYETEEFPNSDFSIVETLGNQIENRGRKLKPSRVISPSAWRNLSYPDHLQMVTGRLEDLEVILRRPLDRR